MKKLNVLCSVLITAVVVSLFTDLFVGADSFARGFMAGWNQAESIENNEDSLFLRCNISPKTFDYHMKMENELNGSVVDFNPTTIECRVATSKDASVALVDIACGITSFVIVGLFIYVWWVFFKLIRNINRGDIFTHDTECGFRRMGITLLLLYACEWGYLVFGYLLATFVMEFDHFNVVLSETPSDYPLVSGLFMIIVAQIFTVARQMKEEQELTI